MKQTELHNLDLGAARFIELQLSLVLRQVFDIEVLKSTALNLVATWPVLSERMNLMRTELSSSKDPELQGLWKSKTLDTNLDEAIPYLKDLRTHYLVEASLVNELVSFKESWKDLLFPRALTIRVVSLNDACLIHFTAQHPFCDANGVHRIAKAYCTLLEGKSLEPLGPRLPLIMREENEGISLPQIQPEPVATRHDTFYAHGWTALLKGGWRQNKNKWGGSNRVEKTAMVPNFVIDALAKEAEVEGIRVTRHDLLMAWIYNATMPDQSQIAQKQSTGPPQFSFVMNIAKLLKHDPEFHNPWLVITLPDLEASSLAERVPIIGAASHIRTTIVDARRSAPVRQILEQHSNVRNSPMGPVDWGCQEPNIAVSSWTNIPLYDLNFVSTGSSIQPEFVQVGVKACPMLRLTGLYFADGILTWTGKEGFWVQGVLHQIAWEKMCSFHMYH